MDLPSEAEHWDRLGPDKLFSCLPHPPSPAMFNLQAQKLRCLFFFFFFHHDVGQNANLLSSGWATVGLFLCV